MELAQFDWTLYWFMLPVALCVATTATFAGIAGSALFARAAKGVWYEDVLDRVGVRSGAAQSDRVPGIDTGRLVDREEQR